MFQNKSQHWNWVSSFLSYKKPPKMNYTVWNVCSSKVNSYDAWITKHKAVLNCRKIFIRFSTNKRFRVTSDTDAINSATNHKHKCFPKRCNYTITVPASQYTQNIRSEGQHVYREFIPTLLNAKQKFKTSFKRKLEPRRLHKTGTRIKLHLATKIKTVDVH